MSAARLVRVAALASSTSLSAAVGGCGQAARAPTVSLLVSGGPPEASVTVDDEPIGSFDTVAAHGVALPPGTHRLTVEAPGYFTVDRLIEAATETKALRVSIRLEKVPR